MRRVTLALIVGVACVAALVGGSGLYVMRRRNFDAAIDHLVVEAQAKLEAGDNAEAERLLATYVPLRPDNKAASRLYATLLLKRTTAADVNRRDKVRACIALETLLRKAPDDDPLRFQLAALQVSVADYTSALEHLRILQQKLGTGEAVRSEPGRQASDAASRSVDRWTVDMLLADALAGSGQFREAIDLLGKLVDFDAATRSFRDSRPASPDAAPGGGPRSPSQDTTAASLRLASLLQNETSDHEAASRVLERAARESPGNAQIWMNLAGLRQQHLKDEAGARDALAKASAIAPNQSGVLYGNFLRCLHDKQPEMAATFAARGRELHPQADWVYAAEATLALQDNDVNRALDSLTKGIATLGATPSLLQPLVDLPFTAKATAGLAARMADIRQKAPANDVYVAVLEARCMIAAGKSQSAKRKLDKVRPLAAYSRALVASIDVALGRCHQRLGEPDLQIAAYRRALSTNPAFIEAHAGAAIALLDCGRDEDALTELRDVAARVSASELAARPEVWRPLLRLESEAIRKLPAGKADWSTIDERVRSLESSPALGRAGMAVLRADVLAGRGRADEAIALLDEAAADAPVDLLLQSARLAAHARSKGAEGFRSIVDSLPTEVRNDPTILRTEAIAAADFFGAGRAEVLADVEERGFGLASDDDSLAILDQLVSLALSESRRDDAARIARRMIDRCPDMPRGPIALCSTGLLRNHIDDVRASAAILDDILGTTSVESRYANAVVRLLEERQDKERLARPDKEKLRDIRNILTEIGMQRPHWPVAIALDAELELLEGNTTAAIANYTRAAFERPKDPVIARQLIVLLVRSRQFAAAERTLATLDQRGLDRVGRYAAELKLRAGKPAEAVALAARTVAAEINDVDDLIWCAGMLRDHGRAADAEAALVLATQCTPERIEPWLDLLAQQSAQDASDRVEATLARGLAAVPEENRPLLQAEGDRLLGRPDEAAAAFRRLAAAPDGTAVALRYAAKGLMLTGQPNEARTTLETLVGRKAASDLERQARAWARRELVKMTVVNAAYPTFMRGFDMLKRNAGGEWTNSLEDASLAVSLLADRPEPTCWRRAVDLLDTLDEKQLLTVDQRVLRATLRDRLGDWDKCRPELLDLAMKPDMPATVYATLVRLLLEHGDAATAEPWLRTLVSLAPEATETIALQSRIMLAHEDRPAAVQEARRLMPAPDAAVDARDLVARAGMLEDLGFRKAADVLLTRAAEKSADGAAARVAALIRWGMAEQAVDVVERAWDDLPLESSLHLMSILVETQGPAIRNVTAERVAGLVEKAAATSPESVERAILQADLQIVSESRQEAETLLRELLSREGLSMEQKARVTAALTTCLSQGDTVTEANDLIETAVREIGPRPDLLDARGIARLARGDSAKAAEDFREACRAPSPNRLLHLAFALCEMGDLDGAREALAQAPQEAIVEAFLMEPDRQRFESLVQRLAAGQ